MRENNIGSNSLVHMMHWQIFSNIMQKLIKMYDHIESIRIVHLHLLRKHKAMLEGLAFPLIVISCLENFSTWFSTIFKWVGLTRIQNDLFLCLITILWPHEARPFPAHPTPQPSLLPSASQALESEMGNAQNKACFVTSSLLQLN